MNKTDKDFNNCGISMGATKNGEYYRTIGMLCNMTNCSKHEIMRILYFLYDSSYNGIDLKNMAELISNERKCLQ